MKLARPLVVAALAVSALSACAPLVIGAIAAGTAIVATDRRTTGAQLDDQSIELRVAAYPQDAFAGTVALVGDVVNPKTRRVTVRCTVTNAEGRLKPQMYATAIIRERQSRPVIVVPSDAIQMVDGRPTVFVAESGDRFRPLAIEIGQAVGTQVEVRSGLQAGERIAVTGTFILKSELTKPTTGEG